MNIFDMFKYYNRDFQFKNDDSINIEETNKCDKGFKREYSFDSMKTGKSPSTNLSDVNKNCKMDSSSDQSDNYGLIDQPNSKNSVYWYCNDRIQLLLNYAFDLNRTNNQTLQRLDLCYNNY